MSAYKLFILILVLSSSLTTLVLTDDDNCEAKTVNVGECQDGLQTVVHQFPHRNGEGDLVCKNVTTSSSCATDMCRCQAVGDPHYRTYDGQFIHYYGVCRYTLSKYESSDALKSCNFNIEVENERRPSNDKVSYIKHVDVQLGSNTFRLDKDRRVLKDGDILQLPFIHEGLRIFYSGNLVQLVHMDCNIQVSFDGDCNAFVEVGKERYEGKLIGICGDCDGEKNDYRTRIGEDVSSLESRQRYIAIGDSYALPDPSACGETELPPEEFCTGEMVDLINERDYCGVISDNDGPFGACIASGLLNVDELVFTCHVDICAASDDKERMRLNRCQILTALQEECAELGFPGILWRANENCPLNCGRNKEYDANMEPCQKTCENHFFGTNTTCYGLPKREGCRCKEGYLLDGEICVLPEDCRCLETCGDSEPSDKCLQWQNEGHCEQNPRIMNDLCRRTCGFCEPPVEVNKCEDHVSTDRCLNFRSKGQCDGDFFKTICGLTCNFDGCPCQIGSVEQGDCAEETLLRSITTHEYIRDVMTGVCEEQVRVSFEECGDCPDVDEKNRTTCDYCTGQITVYHFKQYRDLSGVCMRIDKLYYEDCGTCEQEQKTETQCSNPELITTVSYRERINCNECEAKHDTVSQTITCQDGDEIVGECNNSSCLQRVTTETYSVIDCKCIKDEQVRWQTCCCPEANHVEVCSNGELVSVDITYQLEDGSCKESRTPSSSPVSCPETTIAKGECDPTTCIAIDVEQRYNVDLSCGCRDYLHTQDRVCCCPQTHQDNICREQDGVMTRRIYTYELDEDKNTCEQYVNETVEEVACQEPSYTTKTECNKDTCKWTITQHNHARQECGCVWLEENNEDNCCCLQETETVQVCVNNEWIYSTYIRLLNDNCVRKLSYDVKKEVECPQTYKIEGDCNDSEKQFTETVEFELKECQCHEKRSRKPIDCQCILLHEDPVYEECDTSICLQKWSYQKSVVGEDNECKIEKVTGETPCCCQEKSTEYTYCLVSAGNEILTTKEVIFNAETLTCDITTTRKVLPYSCNEPVISKSNCGEIEQYYLEEVTTKENRNINNCTCDSFVSTRRVRCACPENYEATDFTCDTDYQQRVYESFSYVLEYNIEADEYQCKETVDKRFEKVICEEESVNETDCDANCHYQHIRTYFEVEDCACKQKLDVQDRLCCCPETNQAESCSNTEIVTTVTTYQLNDEKTACLATNNISTTTITCNEPTIVTDGVCDTDACNFNRVIDHYEVIDCKCQLTNSDTEVRKCCCPNDQTSLTCNNNNNIFTKRSFTLNGNGACDVTEFTETQAVECPDIEEEWTDCDLTTGKKSFIRHYYEIIDCECELKDAIINELICTCPDEVNWIHEECIDGDRVIRGQHYVLLDGECVLEDYVNLKEPCEIPPSLINKECINDRQWRTTTTSYKLSQTKAEEGILINELLETIEVNSTDVICQDQNKNLLPCQDFTQCYEVHTWHPVLCSCVEEVHQQDCTACDCDKKNEQIKKCAGDRWLLTDRVYFTNGNQCEFTDSENDIAIECDSGKVITSTGECNEERSNGGIYRRIEFYTTIVNNCGCERKNDFEWELCGCVGERIETECVDNRSYRESVTTYQQDGQNCKRSNVDKVTTTTCLPPSVTYNSCDSYTCQRDIDVVYYTIEECNCKEQKVSVQQTCCAPERKIVNTCANGYLIASITEYTLERGTTQLIPEVDDIYEMIIVSHETVSKKEVTCPNTKETYDVCDNETGILNRKIHTQVEENCQCVTRIQEEQLQCSCPENTIEVIDDCSDGCKQNIVEISYQNVDGSCIESRTPNQRTCCCDADSTIEECTNGALVRTTIKWCLKSNFTCEASKQEEVQNVPCSQDTITQWIDSCNETTGQRRRRITSYHYDKDNCVCNENVIEEDIVCSCPQPSDENKHCVDDVTLEWSSIYYTLADEQCYRHEQIHSETISCMSYHEDSGDCKSDGYRTVSITYESSRDCVCVSLTETREDICDCSLIEEFASKKSVACLDDGITEETKNIYYVLKDGECVEAEETQQKEITCECDKQEEKGECSSATCDMTITTTQLKPNNCKCVRETTSERTEKCCCPSEVVIDQFCDDDATVHVYEFYKLVNGQCQNFTREERNRIDCPAIERDIEHCEVTADDDCGGVLNTENQVIDNCQCVWKDVSSRPIRCCCPPKEPFSKCRGSILYTGETIYRLDNHTCFEETTEEGVSANCETRPCLDIVDDCIDNERRRVHYCYRTENCECKQYIASETTEICGCSSDVEEIEDECINCVVEVHVMIKIFNPELNECESKVLRSYHGKCCCEDQEVISSCVNDVTIRHVTHTEELINYDCIRNVSVSITTLSECTENPKKIDEIADDCDPHSGKHIVTQIFQQAKDCECITTNITREDICCCECIHATKVTQQCLHDSNTLLITTEKSHLTGENQCEWETSEERQNIECNKDEWSIRESCQVGQSTTSRVYWRRYVDPDTCECREEAYNTILVPCICLEEDEFSEYCNDTDNQLYQHYTTWKLNDNLDKCESVHTSVINRVPCEIGEFNTSSRCLNPYDSYTVTNTKRWLENCDCKTDVKQYTCDCQCPSSETNTICDNYRLITTSTNYEENDCRCLKKVSISESEPICPAIDIPIKKGDCVFNGSIGYRNVTNYKHLHNANDCSCTIIAEEDSEVCSCDEEDRVVKKCLKNNRAVEITYKFTKIDNICKYRKQSAYRVLVKCPHDEVTVSSCNPDTNLQTTTTIYYDLTDCQCIRQEKTETSACLCDTEKQLLTTSECQSDCFERRNYSVQVWDNNECINQLITEEQRCCCPNTNRQRRCDAAENRWQSRTTHYEFQNARCIPKTNILYETIDCNIGERLIETKDCDNTTGVISVITLEKQLKDCECSFVPINVEEKRCQCPDASLIKECDVKQGQLKTTETIYELVNDQCTTKINTCYKKISCEPPRVDVICDSNTGEERVIEYNSQITNDCQCEAKEKVTLRRCKCDDTVNVTEICTESGDLIKTTYQLKLTTDRQCEQIEEKQIIPITCEEKQWEQIEGECQTIEDPSVLHGEQILRRFTVRQENCTCVQVEETRPCECNCQSRAPIEECIDNTNLITTIYTAYADSCQCLELSEVSTKNITCSPSERKISQCGDTKSCEQEIEDIEYILENCQCTPKITRRTELCCCNPEQEETVECSAMEGVQTRQLTEWRLENGQCLPTITKETKPFCRPSEIREVLGDCDPETKLQPWILYAYQGVGCDCLEKSAEYTEICGCKDDEVEENLCDQDVCLQEIVTWHYILLNFTCEKQIRSRQFRACCCLEKDEVIDVCKEDHIERTTINYKFDEDNFECVKYTTIDDIVPKCSPQNEIEEGECDAVSGVIGLSYVNRQLVNCQCIENRDVHTGKCTCPQGEESTSCESDTSHVTEVITYVLENYECHQRIDRQVKNIECTHVETEQSDCDPLTCTLKVTRKAEVARNCQCDILQEVFEETCCCLAEGERSYDYCSGEDNQLITVVQSQKYDPVLKVCVEGEHEIRNPITCDEVGQVSEGPCEIDRDHYKYQLITSTYEVPLACKCITRYRQEEALCSCGNPYESSNCSGDGYLVTYEHSEVLTQNEEGAFCEPSVKEINRRVPACFQQDYELWSECDANTCLKTYTKVTYSMTDCQCSESIQVANVTCCCPEAEETKICHDTHVATNTINYNLVCNSPLDCSCEASASNSDDPVQCPQGYTQMPVCDGDKLITPYKSVFYRINNCTCNEVVHESNNERTCPVIPNECRDYLSHSTCLEEYEAGSCQLSQEIAGFSCKLTCGNCGCPNDSFKYLTFEKSSLNTTEIRNRYFLIASYTVEPSKFDHATEFCQNLCSNTTLCKSVEVEISNEINSGGSIAVCHLNNINLKQLRDESGGNFGLVTKETSTVFVKYCECPTDAVNNVTDCQCVHDDDTNAHYTPGQMCSQTLAITKYKPNEWGVCEESRSNVQAICGGACEDKIEPYICTAQREMKHCEMANVISLCAKTCGLCECSGRLYKESKCIDSKKNVNITTYSRNINGFCEIKREDREDPCDVVTCDKGVQYLPGPCINGRRDVIIKKMEKNQDDICIETETSRVENCMGCCPDIKLIPQRECDGGYRTVVKTWHARIGDCCREVRDVSTEKCVGCSEQLAVTYSSCQRDVQLELKSWEENIGGKCVEHNDASIVPCSSLSSINSQLLN